MTASVSDDELRSVVRSTLATASVRDGKSDFVSTGLVREVDVHDGDLVVVVDMSARPEMHDEQVMTAVLEAIGNVPGIEHTRVERVESHS